MRGVISFTLEKHAHQFTQNTTLVLFAAASLFRLTDWFHIHLFHLRTIERKSLATWTVNTIMILTPLVRLVYDHHLPRGCQSES